MAAKNFDHFTLSRGQICLQLALGKSSQPEQHKSMCLLNSCDSSINNTETDNAVRNIQSDLSEIDECLDDSEEDPNWVPPKKTSKPSVDIACHEDPAGLDSDTGEANGNGSSDSEAIKPKKAKKGRADPKKWKRNINQTQRMKGQPYKSVHKTGDGKYTEISKERRQMGPRCCSKLCLKSKSRHCSEFTNEERQAIFSSFWEMDWSQKQMYVSGMVDSSTTKDKTTEQGESRRKQSYSYHLKKSYGRLQVCKSMFLSTLGIGEWSVHHWLSTSRAAGMQSASSENATPKRAKPEHAVKREHVHSFLDCLPKLPSHYCRASTDKMYLEPCIRSQAQLFRLYADHCVENNHDPVSQTVFNGIITEKNIGLFQPKKDQCDICCAYEAGNGDESEYNNHIQRKTQAREEKTKDKEEAEHGQGKVVTLDLQAVLLAPSLKASAMYYKTKLTCHNFTIYDLTSHNVVCYFWHEGEGDLGANSFASCVCDYILNESGNTDRITIYSDGCTYQNRNVTLANALLHVSITKGVTIIQKILEKGHTQMECDSIHSTIERSLRHKPIYSPANYVDVIKSARLSNPYKVKYLDHTFFTNYSNVQYYTSIRPGTKVGDACVTDIRVLKYTPGGQIEYKLMYDEDYQELPRRAKCQVPRVTITQLFDSPVNIKDRKYEHLQQLKKVIPRDYHGFYDALPHSNN